MRVNTTQNANQNSIANEMTGFENDNKQNFGDSIFVCKISPNPSRNYLLIESFGTFISKITITEAKGKKNKNHQRNKFEKNNY